MISPLLCTVVHVEEKGPQTVPHTLDIAGVRRHRLIHCGAESMMVAYAYIYIYMVIGTLYRERERARASGGMGAAE